MRVCLVLALTAAFLPAVARPTTTAHTITTAPDTAFAAQAAALARTGQSFDQIFAALCQTVLANTQTNHNLRLDDQVRAMFGGLWLWTRHGGLPVLQGQNDKALHFIGGGAFEGYWDGGRRAGVRKEEMDRTDPVNYFDLDDLAATLMGSRWLDLATTGDHAQCRQWVQLWATGHCTLSRSLPKLQFGHLPPGQDAPPAKIRAVQDAVRAGLKRPE